MGRSFLALAFHQVVLTVSATHKMHLLEQVASAPAAPAGHNPQTPHPNKKKAEPHRMTLNNSDDVQYVASVQVGGQGLSGIMDTGSFELLVFSKDCRLPGTLYDQAKSKTHVLGTIDKMHSFGSGDTWSHEAFDTVAMGPLQAENQSFWEVVDTAMPILQSSVFQAIVGLGPPGSALQLAQKQAEAAIVKRQEMLIQNPPDTAVLDTEVEESSQTAEHARWKRSFTDNLGVRTYSICIGRDVGDPGYLIWNDHDPRDKPSVFVRLDLTESLHWAVKLSNIRLGGNAAGGDTAGVFLGCGEDDVACGAVLDSGTSLIGAPREAIDKVADVLDSFSGDCSRVHELPDLRFSIGDVEMSLPPESYVGEVSGDIPTSLAEILRFKPQRALAGHNSSFATGRAKDGYSCQPLLMSIDRSSTSSGTTWIFGLPFFRKYYTTFQSFPTEDRSKPGPPGQEFKNEVFVAVADERCSPAPPSLLQSQPQQRLGRRHLKVDASKLRVPNYVW